MDRSPPWWSMCTHSTSSRKQSSNLCNRIAAERSCSSLETTHDNDHLRRRPHRRADRRPYNDFMSEGGKFYEATKETAAAIDFCDNMRKLILEINAPSPRRAAG